MFRDQKIEQVRTDIQTYIPELEITEIDFFGEGMDSRVYLVNNTFIFRFPKYEAVVDPLQVERCLLPRLSSYISVEIPNFRYAGKQSENGLPFVGYPKLKGREVTQDLLTRTEPQIRSQILHDIGTFLREIHSVPIEIGYQCGGEWRRKPEDYQIEIRKMRENIYPYLSEEAIHYVETLYTDFISDQRNFVFTPSLVHGDISGKHLFIDEENGMLKGVIDFGDLHMGDPDYDLIYLYKDYGEAFIRELLTYYSHSHPERLLRKLIFFSRWNAVQDILLGLDRSDEEIIEWAVRDLEREARS